MSGVERSNLIREPEKKLPVRDWVLLPLLAIATVLMIAVSIRWIGSQLYRSSATTINSCLIQNDRVTGGRAIPNTVCYQKDWDTPLTEYKFNNCGHRAGMPCAQKKPDTYRVVMLGSSMDFGFSVAQEQTFAALLPVKLSKRTGRKVEVYNEAMLGEFPRIAARHVPDAIAAQPDLILWVLAPRDVRNASTELISDLTPATTSSGSNVVPTGGPLSRGLARIKSSFASHSLPDAFGAIWQHGVATFRASPSGMLVQHLLFANQTQYVRSSLLSPEVEGNGPDVGFLKTKLNPRWKKNFQWFDRDTAEFMQDAKASGVPVVVMLVPDRVQSAMISSEDWPSDFDPYAIDREVGQIVKEHGGIYVDILPYYKKWNHPESLYFLIDGHPAAAGHAVLSDVMADELAKIPLLPLPTAKQAVPADSRK